MAREEKQHKIEVHVGGICFRETDIEIEVLIAKRSEKKEIYPGKWECGGGQVYAGENFEEAVKRKMEEELGVNVQRVLVFGTYEIIVPGLDQEKIPGIKFICFFDSFSNGVSPRIDEKDFSEWRWHSINKLNEIDFMPGLREDIRTGWEFYSKNKNILRS